MIPRSTYAEFRTQQAALDQKAGTPTSDAAASKVGLQNEVAALTPRAQRYAQSNPAPDDSDNDAAAPVSAGPSSPEPSSPIAGMEELHPDTASALQALGYAPDQIGKLNLPQIRTIIQHKLPAKYSAPAAPSNLPADSPFAKPPDPAADILHSAPVDEDLKAAAWDAYHSTNSPEGFADKIQPLAIPDSIKDLMWREKQRQVAAIPVSPVDRVAQAITKMVALPKDVLAKAEQSPNVLRAFTSVRG
jgi:hypothetical protein